MLNTSLHNPNVKDKPSVQKFTAMNRGINDGGDLPEDLLRVSEVQEVHSVSVIYSPCVQALWIQTEQHIWWFMCVEIWMRCGVSGGHLNDLESTGCPMTVAVIVMIMAVTHYMIIGTCSCCLWPCGFASQASYWSYIPDQCNISTLRSTTNGAKSLSRNHKRGMS